MCLECELCVLNEKNSYFSNVFFSYGWIGVVYSVRFWIENGIFVNECCWIINFVFLWFIFFCFL